MKTNEYDTAFGQSFITFIRKLFPQLSYTYKKMGNLSTDVKGRYLMDYKYSLDF